MSSMEQVSCILQIGCCFIFKLLTGQIIVVWKENILKFENHLYYFFS